MDHRRVLDRASHRAGGYADREGLITPGFVPGWSGKRRRPDRTRRVASPVAPNRERDDAEGQEKRKKITLVHNRFVWNFALFRDGCNAGAGGRAVTPLGVIVAFLEFLEQHHDPARKAADVFNHVGAETGKGDLGGCHYQHHRQ